MIREALEAPDASEWHDTMDIKIEKIRRLNVFEPVPRPLDTGIITLRCIFHRKFENGALVKHKARFVARIFTHISGVDCNEAYLYAPVIRLESFSRSQPGSISILVNSTYQQLIYTEVSMVRFTWSHPQATEMVIPFGNC